MCKFMYCMYKFMCIAVLCILQFYVYYSFICMTAIFKQKYLWETIFGKDLAKYTFSERCEEVPDLPLDDGTKKIFLNMSSKNGRPELVSLLQYMKNTTMTNPDITVRDKRILDLDRIVEDVRKSEEWEDVSMNIYEMGIERGEEQGIAKGEKSGREKGRAETLISSVNALMKNLNWDLQKACESLGISVEKYQSAMKKLN